MVIHAALAVLLYFLVLDNPPVPPSEKGIEVMMGADMEDAAMAQYNEVPAVAPQPKPVEPAPITPDEPLITQDSEESVALPEEKPKQKPKKQEKTPEQIQKEKEEAER